MKKFYRSRADQKIAGICGGLGETFNLDSNLIRLGLVFAALLTHIVPLVVTYIVAWILLPESEPDA